MTMSLHAAARVMREAMREEVKRHSLWYLVQGGVMVLAGILALVYPAVSSFAAVFALGCLLIISGIAQGISLIDAREVPHFWLQLAGTFRLTRLLRQPLFGGGWLIRRKPRAHFPNRL